MKYNQFHSLYVVLFLPLLFIFTQADANNEIAVLTGRFKDFNKADDKLFLNYSVSDFIKNKQEQVRISDKGEFVITLKTRKLIELILDYEGNHFVFLIRPDDSIHVNTSIHPQNRDYKKVNGSLTMITGRGLHCNQLIQQYYPDIKDILKKATGAFYVDSVLAFNDYFTLRCTQLEKQKQELKQLINNNSITDKLFIGWAEAEILFSAGTDLAYYPFIGRKPISHLSDTASYFSFTKDIPIYNQYPVLFASFIKYIKAFETAIEIICNFNEGYASASKISPFPIYYERIKHALAGKNDPYLISLLFESSFLRTKAEPRYLDSMRKDLPPEIFAKLIDTTYLHTYSVTDYISKFNSPKGLKQKLSAYFENTKGRPVYIDFWFTNCAPCMNELPSYNSYMEKYKGRVNFIFFGVYMTKQEWANTIKTLGIKGNHYLLSKNELAFFEKYFSVNSFPHHSILDRNGVLTPETIPPISIFNPKTDSLLQMLFTK